MYRATFSGIVMLLGLTIGTVTLQAQTVMDELKGHSQTANFAAAIEKTNLHERLNQSGPFTLFVPSNAAFDKLSSNQKIDSNLLLNHIFTGMATERSLKVMSDVTCLSGRTIKIENRNNQVSVNSFRIVQSNIRAQNGIIHIIDGVIK